MRQRMVAFLNILIFLVIAGCLASPAVVAAPAPAPGDHISLLEYLKACWWPMMITVTISMAIS